MTQNKDDFYIGYNDEVPKSTRKFLKSTIWVLVIILMVFALAFSLTQKQFVNSTFELTSTTKVTGIYHESPYSMLRVNLGNDTYKNIVLLGFGKFGAEKYVRDLKQKDTSILYKEMTIEGNLIYYNGKTLLQITDENNITVNQHKTATIKQPLKLLGTTKLEGEIVDPKCYFGVMKPGKGKIHRSCAVRCISGGIPPVFASTDKNGAMNYFLMTDLQGAPINREVLPYVGRPAVIQGTVEKFSDSWFLIKTDIDKIELLNKKSGIY